MSRRIQEEGRMKKRLLIAVVTCGVCLTPAAWGHAQATARTQQNTDVNTGQSSVPVYRITVVGRTIKAINYRHRSGSTKVDFRGTSLMPEARGKADVASKQGTI